MKKLIIILVSINSIYAQQGWIQLNSGTTQNISCVYFLDSNYGLAGCDGGIILRTTNGGSNWQSLNLNYSNPVMTVAMPGTSIILAGFTNKIFRSSNSGSSWDTAFGIGSYKFGFVSASIGYLVFPYTSNNLFKTTNAGLNWNLVAAIPTTNIIRTLCFLNETTGFAGGTWWSMSLNVYNSVLLKSSSGGTNWNFAYSGLIGSYSAIYSISFGDNAKGTAIENTSGQGNSKIIRTTNGGDNWTSSSTTGIMNAVESIGSDFAWLCGDNGVIRYTSNGGMNWNSQNTGTTVQLKDITFTNQHTGWAVGNNGVILKTTNGGETGLAPITEKNPGSYSLSQNYPNPFNPITKIKFDLPPFTKGGPGGFVSLKVYDVLGREVAVLVNEQLKPGMYEVEFDGINYPSGIYFYTLTTEGFFQTRKAILIK